MVFALSAPARSQLRAPEPDEPSENPTVVEKAPAPAEKADATGQTLAGEQQRLADDYARLEQRLRRLAQVSSATDPARAALLKQAFAESKQRFLAGQLEALAKSLAEKDAEGGPAFDQVLEGQTKVQTDLKALIDLLQNESRAKAVESETRRLKELAKRLGRLIRSQEGIAGRTESGEDEERLASDQGEVADRTGELEGEVAKHDAEKKAAAEAGNADQSDAKPSDAAPSDAKPGEPKPGEPGESGEPTELQKIDSQKLDEESPLHKRLKQARDAMREAQKKLDEANRKGARDQQQKALDELKAAQAEIEKILRQMREEQVQRTLVALEQRFRAMLDAEIAVHDETKQLDKTPVEARSAEDDIKAGRLARKQQEIVLMCDRALALLRDDGTAAALSEAVEQVGGDMRTVAELLGQSRIDAYTQQIEQDVIAALDEILAAVKQAQQDAKDRPPRPPGDPGDGPTAEPPLVDKLAELKMLRTMQVRVNRRLKQISELVQGDETSDPQLRKGLDELAGRQHRLVEITRDIVTGKTE
ncbi:MAG: hypothetical protein DCC68_20960 [Planctomycetota bacterium]|nr:MAG: hypothetical protein DCC68_20960 [Planctomycetota bacterium]